MKERLNLTKSMGGVTCMPMVSVSLVDGFDEEFADDSGGRHDGCGLVHDGVPVCNGG